MTDRVTQVLEDALKWRKLMEYFDHWPYSPYERIEKDELPRVIREIRDGEEWKREHAS